MRSRIAGRLLPAVLAAATATAIGAPASAQEAPPPAEETYSEEECTEALKILTYFKLLPNQPDIGRALCSLNVAEQQQAPETAQEPVQQDDYTNEINSQYTTESGKAVEENTLLGIPVEWPKSLTIHVPTVNDHWHSYTSTKN
ncbi:hypothetical protein ACN3XK_18395 [Actinomadura welshii]